jgi:uroporphyrinogen decarboxylase
MNSRERVLAAIAHQEPDRVPISFGDPGFSGVFDAPPHGYRALCSYLGVTDYAEPVSSEDDCGVVCNMDQRLIDRLRGDLRILVPGSSSAALRRADGASVDEWGIARHRVGPYWDVRDTESRLRDVTDPSEIDAHLDWPSTTDPLIAAGKRNEATAWRDAGYSVWAVAGYAQDIFHNYSYARGFSRWLEDMYENPAFFHAFAGRILEWDIAYLETFLPPIADVVDVVLLGEDMGTQLAPFMSPDMYRRFCKPYHARWAEAVRRLAPGTPIAMHSCGNVHPIIPDLIDLGVSILNPVQPRARMMEPWRLKRDFGRDLTFLGGFDIQDLLPNGTVQEIRDGAKDLIDTLGPGGGFIFCPSHQVQPDVSPENVVAMYDAAFEFGSYT